MFSNYSIPLLALTVSFVLLASSPPSSGAQAAREVRSDPELERAELAMSRCAAAAAGQRHGEAFTLAEAAESAFRARLSVRPNDVRALVGLARTIGSCRIPGADLALRGELSAESIELLQRALEIEPEHWVARYVLALNYYRAPAFLGRAGDAAREFDRLLVQQGSRNDVAEFARVFEFRGSLWSRAGQQDSALAVWTRGHRLFPTDSALRARLGLPPMSTIVPGGVEPSGAAAARGSLDTIRVVAPRPRVAASPSEHRVRRSDVLTTAGGTADVLQAVQMQPGVTRVQESADLFTRGGDPAETPIFLDGGRIPSVARFEGLSGSTFAAIDPWVVRSARFSSGGFSTRYGNALSGVLDIETDGRPREGQWRAGVGLAQGGATARLPLGARHGLWGTARVTHAGALLALHDRDDEFTRAPYSIEMMGALIAEPKPGTEYRALGMFVRDASARVVDAHGYRGPFDSRGTTQALILGSQHLGRTMPIHVRTNLSVSRRTTEWQFGVLSRDRSEGNGVVRVDAEYAAGNAVTLRAGMEGGMLAREESGTLPTSPAVAPGSPTRALGDEDERAWSTGGYMEGDLRLGRFRVLGGGRVDRLPGEAGITFDPRISISTPVDGWTARLAAGQFHQGRWRAESAIPDGGTPSGLPRRARHIVGGIERHGPVSIRVEGFLKAYGEYRAFGSGPQIVDGAARGVDMVVQRQVGDRITGGIGYSYLDADVELADGGSARSPYDITHTGVGSATVRLARGTTLGSSVRFGTGRPFTPIVGSVESADGRTLPAYGAPTSERLPTYSRVDARLTQYVPLSSSLLVAFAEVVNLLDRRNVAGYVWDANYRERRATTTFYSARTVMIGFELQSR